MDQIQDRTEVSLEEVHDPKAGDSEDRVDGLGGEAEVLYCLPDILFGSTVGTVGVTDDTGDEAPDGAEDGEDY